MAVAFYLLPGFCRIFCLVKGWFNVLVVGISKMDFV